MNEYKKLDKSLNEDLELLRELANAMNERRELTQRLDYLEELIDDNDDHLKNIALYLASTGKTNKRIIDEFTKRFGKSELPEKLIGRVINDFDIDTIF